MKKYTKRFLLLFLCAFLLMQGTMLFAAANTDELPTENPYLDEDGYVIWSYNEETDTIRGLGKEYTRYTFSKSIYFDSLTEYVFYNDIMHSYYGYETIAGYSSDPEIIHLGYYYDDVYVTERGRISLDALQNGEAATFRVEQPYGFSARIEKADVDALREIATKKELDVTTLKNCEALNIVGYDGTDSYACIYGTIYQLDGVYYYVYLMDLGNQYFDADGNFSYRSGTVEAIELTYEQAEPLLRLAHNGTNRYSSYEREGKELGTDPEDETMSITFFVVCAVILGFLLPLPMLIAGICLARSSKLGYPKYWYILTAVSAVWMFVTVIILIILF